jgi:hypothetical protein
MPQSRKLILPEVNSGCSSQGSATRKHPKPQQWTPPELSIDEILNWADYHRSRTGKWPKRYSGPVYLAPSRFENWQQVDDALRRGIRGLPGGSSLPMLLAEHRGARNNKARPPLTIEQILAWADAHRERTGRWPKCTSGRVWNVPLQTWSGIQVALYEGARGLPGGTTLCKLLETHRNVPRRPVYPPLTVQAILAWADEHHGRTGKWPGKQSGRVEGQIFDWRSVENALERGRRGLPGGSSLAKLLAEHRGVRNRSALPPLSVEQIMAWADAHRERTGLWPKAGSGPVQDAPDEKWSAIQAALRIGGRGLPGGTCLSALLKTDRHVPE